MRVIDFSDARNRLKGVLDEVVDDRDYRSFPAAMREMRW